MSLLKMKRILQKIAKFSMFLRIFCCYPLRFWHQGLLISPAGRPFIVSCGSWHDRGCHIYSCEILMEAVAAKNLWFHSVDYCKLQLQMAAISFHYNSTFPRKPPWTQSVYSSKVAETDPNYLGVSSISSYFTLNWGIELSNSLIRKTSSDFFLFEMSRAVLRC